VIVGPANVGKSTLYNQLIQKNEEKAQVTALPGTTRKNQASDSGLFIIVDTPGADAVGDVGEKEQEEALQAATKADFLVIMFDAIQGIKKTELDLYHRLNSLDIPYIIVLNKVDLVGKESNQVVSKAAHSLGIKPEQVIPIVAKTGKNLGQMLIAIASAEPEIVAALGQALPQYRWQLSWRTIVSSASISGLIALVPLPFITFVPLLAIQSAMVLAIARIYNFKINLSRAKELVVTFGLGFLGRSLFYELSKLGGIPGWILSAAIASSITVSMGYAAAVWFESGQEVSKETLKKITKDMTGTLIEGLRKLGKQKPTRDNLQEIIIQSLEKNPAAEDKSNLDK
jgi:GTP-binding protein Era